MSENLPDFGLMDNLQMRMAEVLPELSDEVVRLLIQSDESHLAGQIPNLRIVDRCRCGDDFCSSFYSAPKPSGSYGPNHRTVELNPVEGMLILDIVDGQIHHIEVLYRDEVRSALEAALP